MAFYIVARRKGSFLIAGAMAARAGGWGCGWSSFLLFVFL
jgi:hypothetical protein